jgi:hypothetical protein
MQPQTPETAMRLHRVLINFDAAAVTSPVAAKAAQQPVPAR